MNDFLKDLIKSVDELDKASGFKVISIFDEIKKKYNDHVEYLRENDFDRQSLKNDFDRKSLMNELALCQYQLKECTNEVNQLREELKTLKDNPVSELKWEQSFMLANEIFISKNTFLYCVIRENDNIGFRLTAVDKRDSEEHIINFATSDKCKQKAEEIYKGSIKKQL